MCPDRVRSLNVRYRRFIAITAKWLPEISDLTIRHLFEIIEICMDSRIVSREIRREVWPALHHYGFQTSASRRAFRLSPQRIWVVEFQSFNSYFSLVDGRTTYSFAVNLAIYLPALADDRHAQAAKPHAHECHIRRKLAKSIEQLSPTIGLDAAANPKRN